MESARSRNEGQKQQLDKISESNSKLERALTAKAKDLSSLQDQLHQANQKVKETQKVLDEDRNDLHCKEIHLQAMEEKHQQSQKLMQEKLDQLVASMGDNKSSPTCSSSVAFFRKAPTNKTQQLPPDVQKDMLDKLRQTRQEANERLSRLTIESSENSSS